MNFEAQSNPYEGPKPPPLPKRERIERRPDTAQADRLLSQARMLDERFARLFATRASEEGSEIIRKLEVIEVLSDGVEDDGPEFALENEGVNVTSRKLYVSKEEGAHAPEPVEGITKAEWGEVSYTLKDGEIKKILRRAQPSGAIEEELVSMSRGQKSEQKLAQTWTAFLMIRPEFIRQIAEQYDIEESEVPMHPERMSFFYGVDVGQQTRSEFTVSRIDQLCGLDTVPITVLRKEKHGLASVQELVEARETIEGDFTKTLKLPAEHPTVKSLIRIACLDYLTQGLDRHPGNIMFDEARQTFIAIDNGLAMGLSVRREVKFADKETGEIKRIEQRAAPLNGMNSVPIELAELRPDWKLDDEAWQIMKTLYDELFQYAAYAAGDLSFEDQQALPPGVVKGELAEYLSDLFRFQYQQEKVAAKELMRFLGRLRHLIDRRRVPPMRDRTDFHIYYSKLDETGIIN
jgi:hypothetical protein